jgi:Domain of unknown function (DUF1877)
MGMRGHLRHITPTELDRLQRNPENVKELLHGKAPADLGAMLAVLQRTQKIALDARTAGLLDDPVERERVRAQVSKELDGAGVNVGAGVDDGPTEDGLNLEKSWHVLHYLLTGKVEGAPPPLGNAILGGQEIGGDLGYGPARFLTAQQVHEVAIALGAISKDDLTERFDLKAMIAANIFPVRDKSELRLAQDYFEQVSRYYAEAAADGNAMLLWLV